MPSLNLNDRTSFLIEYMNLKEATGDPNAQWEPFQIKFLNQDAVMTSDLKSRQVGWSFIAAADAVADAVLNKRSTEIFISMTRNEAAEKVRYATYCLEALDADIRPKLVIENRQELEFSNGSRIISHPCRPIRGKARARVYLDEMAHYINDEAIYTATVPVITRGGVLRIGSSPLGASGKFYEIHSEALQPYPGYVRSEIPWWVVRHLCRDPHEASAAAASLSTEELVRAYGTERLIHIFENMPLDSFEQEYALDWSDDSVAWITWDEIRDNQHLDQNDLHLFYDAQVGGRNPVDDAYTVIDTLLNQIHRNRIPPVLYAGMDVGRRRNTSELILTSVEADDTFPYRLGISMDDLRFETQYEIVDYALQKLPVLGMLIDETGLGMALAEKITDNHAGIAEGISFTAPIKEEMAVNMKVRFQNKQAPIPLDRDLASQIHSVKKRISAGHRVLFDVDTSGKHHADRFWALALAHFATLDLVGTMSVSGSPIAGYRG